MAEHGAAACAACGGALRPDQRFCPSCGAAAPPARSVEAIFSLPALPSAACGRGGGGEGSEPAAIAPVRHTSELITFVLVGGVAVALWAAVLGDDIPAFATVLDFKITLATAVLLLAGVQLLTAAVLYGRLRPPWPPADAAAFMHRWGGRGLIVAAALVMVYCVKDIGPQADPTRAAIHSTAGSVVFLVVAAKLLILRGVPRLSGLVPVLGVAATALFVALWLTSALVTLRARAQGYAGADIGATVVIVTDPQTIGRFTPLVVRVRVGQAVQWVNQDAAPHNVVRDGGGFDSGVLGTGAGFRWPARQPATVTYRCTLHPQMPVATIVVENK